MFSASTRTSSSLSAATKLFFVRNNTTPPASSLFSSKLSTQFSTTTTTTKKQTTTQAKAFMTPQKEQHQKQQKQQQQKKLAKRIEHKTLVHDIETIDHYSWIRDKDNDNDVMRYIHSENHYTEKYLIDRTRSLQNTLFEEFKSRIKETDVSVPFKNGPFMYYHRTVKDSEYAIYCRKPIIVNNSVPVSTSIKQGTEEEKVKMESDDDDDCVLGEEQVLLDLNELAKREKSGFLSLGTFHVSPDHSILGYSIDTEGDEVYTMYFKCLKTGRLFNDVIEEVTDDLEWMSDNRTIFYCTMDSAMRPYKVYKHVLNLELQEEAEQDDSKNRVNEEEEEDEEEEEEENEEDGEGEEEEEVDRGSDECVYTESDEKFSLALGRTCNERFIMIHTSSHTTSEILYMRMNDPSDTFKVLFPRQHMIEYDVDHHGEHFYVLENMEGRSNFRLVRTPEQNPSLTNVEEILAHDENRVLESVTCFKSFLLLNVRESGLSKLLILNPETFEQQYIAFPDASYSLGESDNDEFDTDFIRLYYTSLVTPATIFDYHVKSNELKMVRQYDVLNYDPSQYFTDRLLVDSTVDSNIKIPLTIVYKKTDTVLDGSSPCLLYGYGSYCTSYDAEFDSTMISLLDRGFIVAIAHIRGGGEYGKKWHDQGKLMNKKNTFSDFVDCAKYLINNKYTSPERLAIRGASAGGLLVGNVVNSHPHLFSVAINEVGFVDVVNSMLDTSLPLTTGEFEEFGDPTSSIELFRYMQSYSPYENILSKENIESTYPAMLVTTALNDPRVPYFEGVKYTAKLRWYFQNMHKHNPDSHTLYLKMNLEEGHGGKSGRYESLKDEALIHAFLLTHVARNPIKL